MTPFFVISLIALDPLILLFALLFGWLLDADHEVDYYKRHGKLGSPFTLPNDMSKDDHVRKSDKAYIPLHAWEWIPLIAFVTSTIFGEEYVLFTVTPFLIHMIMDLQCNWIPIECYSIIWRIKHKWTIPMDLAKHPERFSRTTEQKEEEKK
jgi:hypothetical protein